MYRLWAFLYFSGLLQLALIPRTIPFVGCQAEGNWPWLLAATVGMAVATCWGAREETPKASIELTICMAIAALTAPFPLNLGPLIMLAAALSQFVALRTPMARPFGLGLLMAGTAISVQSVVSPMCLRLLSRVHDINWLAGPTAALLRLTGLDAFVSGCAIGITTVGRTVFVTTSAEKLGVHLCVILSVGYICLAWLACQSGVARRAWAFLGVCCLYALLRYAYQVHRYLDAGDSGVFWRMDAIAVSFIPLMLIGARAFPLAPPKVFLSDSGKPRDRRRVWYLALLYSAVCGLFVLTVHFHDPGQKKAGRIVIDEHHSKWERSEIKLDTKTYGVKTVYNYYCMVEYFRHFYASVKRNSSPLSEGVLNECDVLILKTPTIPYSAHELKAIEEFVRAGGGLWLIGDHTNVFGMDSHLNQVASRFGFSFNFDAVTALPGGRQLYRPPSRFAHPIVANMPTFLFATSDSLEAPVCVEDVIVGHHLMSDSPDYSVNTFFGDFKLDGAERFGSFVQAFAMKHGEGRVAAFSDSTVFSNFTMFMPGKPELALGMIEWLNRKNLVPWVNRACAILGALLAAFTVSFRWRLRRNRLFLAVACGIALGGPGATWACVCLKRLAYPLPEARQPFVSACFDYSHCRFGLPVLHETHKGDANSFQTFFVWSQRLGIVPSVQHELGDCLSGDMVVLVRPRTYFRRGELAALREYVQEGGKLLIIDGPSAASTANQVASMFGMGFGTHRMRSSNILDVHQQNRVLACRTVRSTPITGGSPLLRDRQGRTLLAKSEYGSGLVLAFSDDYLFCDKSMGSTSNTPTAEQYSVYQIVFDVFRILMDPTFWARRSSEPPDGGGPGEHKTNSLDRRQERVNGSEHGLPHAPGACPGRPGQACRAGPNPSRQQ